MSIPLPGQPVRGSRSGAPIMALFDLLGRRWAMGILWTLAEVGPLNFRDLQRQCESISPAVLNVRLRELRDAQMIDHDQIGYRVLPRGRELYEMLVPMGKWSKVWAKDVTSSLTRNHSDPRRTKRGMAAQVTKTKRITPRR
jgi:DNA-binding HxlR family transcriptional regulator